MKMCENRTEHSIGDYLRRRRQEMGLTQEAVAKKTFISRSTITRYETGEQELKASDIVTLCEIYDKSCDAILRGIQAKQSDIINYTGLNGNAQKWLHEKVTENDWDTISAVNTVLGNNIIADSLFEIIKVYISIELPTSVVEADGTLNGSVSAYLADEETLLRTVLSGYIQRVLQVIRDSEKNKRISQREEKLKELIEKMVENDKLMKGYHRRHLTRIGIENEDDIDESTNDK